MTAASAVVRRSPAIETVNVSALVSREAPKLLDYFVRRVRDREDAADLLGETLVVVWRRASSIPTDEERARMWLYGVARKVLSGHRRTSDRRSALTDRLRQFVVESDVAPDTSHVRELINELGPVDREIIGLVYWEGFSLADVAQIMSMRAATVRSRHARARDRLRVRLESN